MNAIHECTARFDLSSATSLIRCKARDRSLVLYGGKVAPNRSSSVDNLGSSKSYETCQIRHRAHPVTLSAKPPAKEFDGSTRGVFHEFAGVNREFANQRAKNSRRGSPIPTLAAKSARKVGGTFRKRGTQVPDKFKSVFRIAASDSLANGNSPSPLHNLCCPLF